MTIKFTVPGEPTGKGRPVFSTVAGHAKARTPEKTVLYENLIKTEYHRQVGKRFPDDAMLDFRLYAYYAIPKSTSKKKKKAMAENRIRPTKKPDWDNIGKTVCDALNGIAYRDDAQVVDSMVRKFYSENPRIEVRISDIELIY